MTDGEAQEIEAVKRLLILLLMKLGATADEIGTALQISGRRVRQLVPSQGIEKISLLAAQE